MISFTEEQRWSEISKHGSKVNLIDIVIITKQFLYSNKKLINCIKNSFQAIKPRSPVCLRLTAVVLNVIQNAAFVMLKNSICLKNKKVWICSSNIIHIISRTSDTDLKANLTPQNWKEKNGERQMKWQSCLKWHSWPQTKALLDDAKLKKIWGGGINFEVFLLPGNTTEPEMGLIWSVLVGGH